MEIKACRTPEQVEEHWRRIIEAVRGKKMCQVWYEFKLGSVQQASATNPTRPEPMASLTCRADIEPGGKLLVTQPIPHTDFPLDGIKLSVVHGSIDGVHRNSTGMLPSEY